MQSEHRFELQDGCLCKVGTATGQTVARHAPIGSSMVQTVPIGSRVVVREDYYEFPRGQSNIYCLTGDFDLAWSAELPWKNDIYANPIIPTPDGFLSCASWDGMSCTLDPETGCIIKKVFTR